ncbi:MAG: hypothetical protein IJY71_01340, partial [Clostridia bacterium]|nr:hypothetical protein [Clostridia bacterium]
WLYCDAASRQIERQMRLPVWVIRQGRKIQIPQEKLVRGDLMILEEGSVVPFTAYLVSREELTVWTEKNGRYCAMKKRGGVFFGQENPPNILRQGDIVRQGRAIALVIAPSEEAFLKGTDEGMPTQLLNIGRMVSRICYLLAFLMMAISFFVFRDSAAILTTLLCVAALMALSPLEWLDFLAEAIFYIKNASLLRARGTYIKSLRRIYRLAHADCVVLPSSFFVSGDTTYVNSFLNAAGTAVPLKKGSRELSFVASCLCAMEQENGARQKRLSEFFAASSYKELPRLLCLNEVGGEKEYASVATFRWESGGKPFSLVGGDAAFLLSHILYAKENGRTHLLDAKTKEKLLSVISLYKTNGYRVVAYAESSFVPRHKDEPLSFDALCDMKLCGFLVLGALPNREVNEFFQRTVKEGKKAVIFYNGADPSDLLHTFSKRFSFDLVEGVNSDFENKVAAFAAAEERHFLILCGVTPLQKAGTVRALEAVGYSVAAYGEGFAEHRMLCAARAAVSLPFAAKASACGVVYDTAEVHSEKSIRSLDEAKHTAKDMIGAVCSLTVYLSVSLLLRTAVSFFGIFFSLTLLSPWMLLAFGVALDLSVVFGLAYMHFPQGANGEEKKTLSHVFAWIGASAPTALAMGIIAVCVSLYPSAFPFTALLFASVSLILLLNVTLLSFSRVRVAGAAVLFPLYSLCLAGALLLTGMGGSLSSLPVAFSLLCWVLLPLVVFIVAEKLLQIFFKNHIKIKEIYYE